MPLHSNKIALSFHAIAKFPVVFRLLVFYGLPQSVPSKMISIMLRRDPGKLRCKQR